jgi:cytochrome c556
MRTWRMAGVGAVALVAALGWTAATVLADEADAVIKDRQDTMKMQGRLLGTAVAFGEGRVEQEEAIAAVTNLIKTTNTLIDKFPAGTGMTEFPGKSGAKPEIWTEWDKFKEAPKVVIEQEEKLLTLIKAGDKPGVQAQAKATWDNGCQVCHRPYRAKL